MLRLIVVGALGYLGYKYLGSNQAGKRHGRESPVAGGPLSEQARLQSNPDHPPAVRPLGAPTPAAA